MRWLYDIPDWVMAVLVVAAAMGLSVGGFFATRPLRVRASNDVAGPVLATVGLVQGVLLALVAGLPGATTQRPGTRRSARQPPW